MSKTSADEMRKELHYMMGTAFMEIRAAESLAVSKKLASVFHNLPMRLLRCKTEGDYEAEFADLLDRAKRAGLEDYLLKLRQLAKEVT